mmetsp:Transcript_5697/g.16016  ORF Transcript_5697/g.16016 Transcript_5697/m.16016 type:complete len:230 (+) Transcript_5697:294-983(+)
MCRGHHRWYHLRLRAVRQRPQAHAAPVAVGARHHLLGLLLRGSVIVGARSCGGPTRTEVWSVRGGTARCAESSVLLGRGDRRRARCPVAGRDGAVGTGHCNLCVVGPCDWFGVQNHHQLHRPRNQGDGRRGCQGICRAGIGRLCVYLCFHPYSRRWRGFGPEFPPHGGLLCNVRGKYSRSVSLAVFGPNDGGGEEGCHDRVAFPNGICWIVGVGHHCGRDVNHGIVRGG